MYDQRDLDWLDLAAALAADDAAEDAGMHPDDRRTCAVVDDVRVCDLFCPGCEVPAVPDCPVSWDDVWGVCPEWSHADGSPLCGRAVEPVEVRWWPVTLRRDSTASRADLGDVS